MECLVEGIGLSIEGIYWMVFSEEMVKVNVMLVGLGSTCCVIMGDMLFDKFIEEEIEVVFVYEVGYYVY